MEEEDIQFVFPTPLVEGVASSVVAVETGVLLPVVAWTMTQMTTARCLTHCPVQTDKVSKLFIAAPALRIQ